MEEILVNKIGANIKNRLEGSLLFYMNVQRIFDLVKD
jgi:hypothetical protein|tara:strand:+ start:4183 stop:4293 length:111 start_codon:yes stop_codon:yes gene_type:complete